jgi:phosphonopyruvate decarboxylase
MIRDRMISATEFFSEQRDSNRNFLTGVPCSFLTPFINHAINDRSLDYVGAASEGEAVAIAAGAWLAGRETTVMCQNSGLGNAVNPLTSLNFPCLIPTMLIVTWRGQPGLKDEPQHELMGQISHGLLSLMRIPHREFPRSASEIRGAIDAAEQVMSDSSLPFAFVMEKDSIESVELEEVQVAARQDTHRSNFIRGGETPSRWAALERLLSVIPEAAAVVATTGKCGRELFQLNDRPQHFYQVGSMGCASAMALGIALNSDSPVIALDGDGAALMKMGVFATIGSYAPPGFIHILLDNGVHDSTGGQTTVSSSVDFAGVAQACGYRFSSSCDDLEGFETALAESLDKQGPCFIHLRISPGSVQKLGRPTVRPHEVARRFRGFLMGSPISDENKV